MEVIVLDFNGSENIENTEKTKILKIQVAYDILSTVSSSFQVVFRSFIIKHNMYSVPNTLSDFCETKFLTLPLLLILCRTIN